MHLQAIYLQQLGSLACQIILRHAAMTGQGYLLQGIVNPSRYPPRVIFLQPQGRSNGICRSKELLEGLAKADALYLSG